MKAVIFDMDGVLLDSEPYYYRYLNKKFAKLGLSVSDEEYKGFVGLPSGKVWEYLEKARGVNLGIEELMKKEEIEVNDIFKKSQLRPIHGVVDFLELLASRDVLMNVASSSYKSTIELIIGKLSLNRYFRFLTSGAEVSNGKPHPDIFLRSAKLLNMLPESCIVIEDSTNGVLGAKRAGMTCVGFSNPGSGKQDLSKADIIIENYSKESIQSILKLLQ